MIRNIKIGLRLNIGFGIIFFLTFILGMVAINRMDSLALLTTKMYRHPLAVSNAVRDIKADILAIQNELYRVRFAQNSSQLQAVRQKMEALDADAEKKFALVKERFLGNQTDINTAYDYFKAWRPIRNKIIAEKENAPAIDDVIAEPLDLRHVLVLQNSINKIVDFATRKGESFWKNAESQRAQAEQAMYWILFTIIAVGSGLALLIARSISKPISQIAKAAKVISSGDLSESLDDDCRDEIGELSASFRDMEQYIRSASTIMEQISQGDLSVEARPNSKQDVLFNSFSLMINNLRDMIGKIIEYTAVIESNSSNLENVSRGLLDNAGELNRMAQNVADSSQQMNLNINDASANTGDIRESISRIARNAEQASQITSKAVHQSSSVVSIMDELKSASSDINQVIEVITEIAEQTKLLALNATIEAARAGEAGKGFAVVANEVKELAQQTNKATDEINKKIEAIQNATGQAVGEIETVSTVINDVNEIVGSIASAVDEQNRATQGIAQSIGQAAVSSQGIVSDISNTSMASNNVYDDTGHVRQAAGDLMKIGHDLKDMIARFRLNRN